MKNKVFRKTFETLGQLHAYRRAVARNNSNVLFTWEKTPDKTAWVLEVRKNA